MYVHFTVFVRLSGSEVLLFVLCILNPRLVSQSLHSRATSSLTYFVLLFAFSVLTSDFILSEFSVYTLKSLARPLFILTTTLGFWILFQIDSKTLLSALVGIWLGTLLQYFFNSAQENYDFSSLGMEYAFFVYRTYPLLSMTICFVTFLLLPRGRIVWFTFLVIGIALIARGGGRGATLVWIVYLIMMLGFGFLVKSRESQIFNILKVALLVTLTVVSVGVAYQTLAPYGYFGAEAQKKIEQTIARNENSFLGIFLNGRTEVYAAILIIFDSPLLGLGSDGDAVSYYAEAYILANLDTKELWLSGETLRGRGHSTLLSAWSFNGFLSVPFWLFVAKEVASLGLTVLRSNSRYSAVILYLVVEFFWSLLFSPLSVQARTSIGLLLAASACLTRKT